MSHSILKQPSNEDIVLGKTFSLSKQMTEEDLVSFGKLSKDFNPLHFSEELAQKTRFCGRIVHGMLTSSLFSGVLARLTPWCALIEQLIQYTAPVHIGDTITATGIIDKLEENDIISVLLICKNQNNQNVSLGIAKMKKLKEMYKN